MESEEQQSKKRKSAEDKVLYVWCAPFGSCGPWMVKVVDLPAEQKGVSIQDLAVSLDVFFDASLVSSGEKVRFVLCIFWFRILPARSSIGKRYRRVL